MKKASAKIDYEGKKVFVGIDVHKRSYSVVAVVGRNGGQEMEKRWPVLIS